MTFGSDLGRKKKSLLLLSSTMGFPSRIRWALRTMSLVAACRKILVRVTWRKALDSRRSCRMLPGPTEGSWLASPTRIRCVPGLIAERSDWNSHRSTMDISSMMMAEASRGWSLSFSKANALTASLSGSAAWYSRSRWIVFASRPVASAMRFAARPVGAARRTGFSSPSKQRMIALIVVVFPVPGPPVRSITPPAAALRTASFCRSSSRIFSSSSICRMRSSTVSCFMPPAPAASRSKRSLATAPSACQTRMRKTKTPSSFSRMETFRSMARLSSWIESSSLSACRSSAARARRVSRPIQVLPCTMDSFSV